MKKTICLVVALLFAMNVSADHNTLSAWNEYNDKKFTKRLSFISNLQYTEKMFKKFKLTDEEIPKLKRVGVLGLSMYQPTAGYKAGNSIYTPYFTEAGEIYFLDKLYTPTLQPMKEAFAEQGIELLMPAEFLDTPQKRTMFENTEFEMSGLFKTIEALQSRIRAASTSPVKSSYEGTKFIGQIHADPKVWREVGKFAGDIGLDAVLVVETQMAHNGGAAILQSVNMTLAGPNSVPYNKEHENYYAPFGPLKGYLEGIIYGALTGTSPKGGMLFAAIHKGKVHDLRDQDVGVVYGRIAKQLLLETNNEIAKLQNIAQKNAK